jgi:hypothetical protein
MPTAQILIDIQPVEIDGKHWVTIRMGELEMKPRGPYPDAKAAEAAADKLIQHWQPPTANPPPATAVARNDTIMLHGKPTELTSSEGCAFVRDCTRSAEGLTDDETLQKIYEIEPKNWKAFSENVALIKAIRDERARRVRSGQAARESAAKIFVRATAVLGTILDDKSASPRHRIESARELRQTAHGGDSAETTPDVAERFIIRIDLSAAPGGEALELNKEITPRKSPPTLEQLERQERQEQHEGEPNAEER